MTRVHRPGEVGSHRVADYGKWAAERIVAEPESILDPDLARADYLGWASDRIAKPEPRSRQRAAVKAAGATATGRGPSLLYRGIRLDGPGSDSGYRAPTLAAGDEAGDPEPALLTLWAAGLATHGPTLERAWLRLTGTPARALCRHCGTLTRYRDGHNACRRQEAR